LKKRVAVLMGGRSAERDISLMSGEQIFEALQEKKYDAAKIQMNGAVVENLKQYRPDIVFLALHGRFGEDGTVQGLLEILDIPYTGSGVMASSIAMNKVMAKRIFKAANISTPSFIALKKDFDIEIDSREIIKELGLPVVVKPACEGSTIGISIVRNERELASALELAFSYGNEVIVEKFIDGTEITVGILGNEPAALPALEIVTETELYDYKTKYTDGLSKHIIPARISQEQQDQAQKVALAAHNAIGCRDYSRVDFIVDKEGMPHVLEINTLPGMTKLSLYPDAARAAGYSFPDLVSKIVELALNK
jgi:D-alanine-D-alanine ligase